MVTRMSVRRFLFVNPYFKENYYNSGRIFTIRAKPLEKKGKIHIVIVAAIDFFYGNFSGRVRGQ